ncbi:MAG: DNA translocase FtsK 4TM domain-containing protein [Desulfovibrionaceae bacterium]
MAKKKRTPRPAGPPRRIAPELGGLLLVFLAALLFVAVFTFHPKDPTFSQSVSGWAVQNLAGRVGSYSAGLLADLFGFGAYLWPPLVLWFGLSRVIHALRLSFWRWVGFWGAYLCILAWLEHPWLRGEGGGLTGGGLVGAKLMGLTLAPLRGVGAFLLWTFLSLVFLHVLFRMNWTAAGKRLRSLGRDLWAKHAERRERRAKLDAARRVIEPVITRPERPRAEPEPEPRPEPEAAPRETPPPAPPLLGDELLRPFEPEAPRKRPARERKAAAAAEPIPGELPPVGILAAPPASAAKVDQAALQQQALSLTSCLNDFGIQGEIATIVPGPVVTMFEFRPAPGVKISRIAALSDDIALALKALSVRVVAPIPGKDTVGVEIPNRDRQTVYLREIVESQAFTSSGAALTVALGKDISGRPQVADLARMPHLLMAGATGKGKSVCLNSMLVSLLFRWDPDRLKLLLVDPKRIELSVYAELPHLVHPVVTDPVMAKSALDWAVHEMDERYEAMARLQVRNLEAYNEKLAKLGGDLPEELADLTPIPYLVIVIDELADLMLTAAKEVETSIVRLAQLARAAGIHLVLATQRPSVDVVTGLIKANFPTRVSFEVTSRHDSRTILDAVGAERLLGRGDMLYRDSGSRVVRLHGPLVQDGEIGAVVEFWRQRFEQRFDLDFAQWGGESDNGGGEGAPGDMNNDPMYQEAVEFVLSQGKASISLIQRRFRIGFNRAARFIEQMELDGMLGPQEGAKPRKVIGAK